MKFLIMKNSWPVNNQETGYVTYHVFPKHLDFDFSLFYNKGKPF